MNKNIKEELKNDFRVIGVGLGCALLVGGFIALIYGACWAWGEIFSLGPIGLGIFMICLAIYLK